MSRAYSRSVCLVPGSPETGWPLPAEARVPQARPMPRFRTRTALLIAIVSVMAASCHKQIQSRPFVPPPPIVRPPFVPPAMPQVAEAPNLEAVPTESDELPMIAEEFPMLPPPPEPPKKPVVVQTPRPAPPPPVTGEPVPSPRLGQIFTAEQLREYNRALEESMSRARTVLAVVGGRRLNTQQLDMVARIRTFMMQAEQARQKDLVTAVNLARRADLLARDLSGSLQ